MARPTGSASFMPDVVSATTVLYRITAGSNRAESFTSFHVPTAGARLYAGPSAG